MVWRMLRRRIGSRLLLARDGAVVGEPESEDG